jgi:hypothetical protein
MVNKITVLPLVMILFVSTPFAAAGKPVLDERPAKAGEWGYRPADGAVSQVNPPSFSWRPQDNMTCQIECARDTAFEKIEYRAQNIKFNVHCPPRTFKPGTYAWRYRGKDQNGNFTNWSRPRTFSIADDAVAMPLPSREKLLARIPKTHPRLFVRPEKTKHLRKLAKGKLKDSYEELVKKCEELLANPPSTQEPPKYPKGTVVKSEQWRNIWWPNRGRVIAPLNGAATLAFTRLLGGREEYGLEAKRILLECAKWDPAGSTSYRYNDEAGMPYAYYFARTYTFLNDLLTEDEKKICRDVMKIRGDEMYHYLNAWQKEPDIHYPHHFWQPYGSHTNRAWHFLGEVGIAFIGEVEGAEDWVWFAANVFFNVYPVWSDDDGGWHEGTGYWASYQGRFTWWADVMREAMGINAYDKPYYSKLGYYAMYLMPPGKVGGGFGDHNAKRTAEGNAELMSVLAAQAHNGHWQWYVEQLGGPVDTGGYIGFIRGALPEVKAVPPDDLPTSRLFRGTGQAYLNSDLTDANESVQVVFKSSPLGTQSHGYEANNSFLLWAYGQRLLIRSGYREIHGSEHHKNWMWSTRSTNCITVNSRDQKKHSPETVGRITAFKTTPSMDIVVGQVGDIYDKCSLERFTRSIIFIKPQLVVVYDRLEAEEPSTFQYWLHAINKFDVKGQHQIQVRNADAVCDIDFLAPSSLALTQTNQYDPNPRPRIKLREWHLTATNLPSKSKRMEFVTLYRPHRIGDQVPKQASLEKIEGGYALKVKLSDGEFTALLPTDDTAVLEAHGLKSKGAIKARLKRGSRPVEIIGLEK